MEGTVLGARVIAESGDEGPKDAADQSEDEEEAALNPVHRGIAGFTGMPVGSDAREMKEMLAGELGEMVEGPVELVFNPGTDEREWAKEGSVATQEAEGEEVEAGDTEAEAGGGTPRNRRSDGRNRHGWFDGNKGFRYINGLGGGGGNV